LADVSLIIFGAPHTEFTSLEVADLTHWLNNGGRILLMTCDGAFENDESSLLKNFLERLDEPFSFVMIISRSFGIVCNNDSVLRSVYYKYLHPKEVFIADGILVPDLARKKVLEDSLRMLLISIFL
jgi:intraflagellar transport protein 52